ncbi:CHASE3 domain-containing protein, partial [Steroidobacter sp.]|uniref:CHASE3 domain-containing protein n=1 Tax=Steroidobacter sp. TaxID=1978227 RepID=UPI001A4E60C1
MHASSLGQTGLPDPALRTDPAATAGIDPRPASPAAIPLEPTRRSLLSIGVRIAAGFGVALLLLGGFSMAVNSRLDAAAQERQWVQHSLEVLSTNERALRMIRQAEAAARGFKLTNQLLFRQQFDSSVIDTERTLSELRALTADNPTQQEIVGTLVPVIRQRFQSMRLLFEPNAGSAEEVVMAGAALMDRVEQLSGAVDREDRRLLSERRERAGAAEQLTKQLVAYGALLAVLLIALTGWLVTRSILRPVDRLSAGARRIARGEYQVPVAISRDDELGQLAASFNHMAADISARELALSEQDWLNSSLARLSRLLEGARDPSKLGAKILGELAVLVGARQSLIYVPTSDGSDVLELQASYASD